MRSLILLGSLLVCLLGLPVQACDYIDLSIEETKQILMGLEREKVYCEDNKRMEEELQKDMKDLDKEVINEG